MGRIITPRTRLAARMPSPPVPDILARKGTSRVIPNSPMTTEGMPASSSTPRLITLPMDRGATWSMKTAVPTPRGAPMSTPPRVVMTVPLRKASMPYLPAAGSETLGAHSRPKRLAGPSSRKAGRLSLRMKKKMSAMPRKLAKEQASMIHLAKPSVFFISRPRSLQP